MAVWWALAIDADMFAVEGVAGPLPGGELFMPTYAAVSAVRSTWLSCRYPTM